MIDELEKILPAFSSVNRTRCFAHILNLIAKSILRLFDVKPKKPKEGDGDGGGDSPATGNDENGEPEGKMSDEERELLELAGDIVKEELTAHHKTHIDNDDAEDDDDDKGWVDEVAEMSEQEQAELKEFIRPVSCTLVKVRSPIVDSPLTHTDSVAASKNQLQVN